MFYSLFASNPIRVRKLTIRLLGYESEKKVLTYFAEVAEICKTKVFFFEIF